MNRKTLGRRSSKALVDSLSIDDVNSQDLPSLAAFYRASDYDGSTGTLKDQSKNGLDLRLICTREGQPMGVNEACTADPAIIAEDGYISVGGNWALVVDVTGTPLDTLTNHVIWVVELNQDNANSDTDYGTGWQGGAFTSDADTFNGFNLGAINNVVQMRTLNAGASKNLVNYIGFEIGDKCNFAYGFKPGTGGVAAYRVDKADGSVVLSGLTVGASVDTQTSLTAQNGKFGIRATGVGSNCLPFKTIQVWSFPSLPFNMDATVEWLAHNPNRIPPWFIGYEAP